MEQFSLGNNYTTIKQSKKLLKLGLNPNTADMFYLRSQEHVYVGDNDNRRQYESHWDTWSCWSIGALIKALPCFIKHDGKEYGISIFPDGLGGWCVDYSTFETKESLMDYIDKSLVDALFYMCCWLLENNFISKN